MRVWTPYIFRLLGLHPFLSVNIQSPLIHQSPYLNTSHGFRVNPPWLSEGSSFISPSEHQSLRFYVKCLSYELRNLICSGKLQTCNLSTLFLCVLSWCFLQISIPLWVKQKLHIMVSLCSISVWKILY